MTKRVPMSVATSLSDRAVEMRVQKAGGPVWPSRDQFIDQILQGRRFLQVHALIVSVNYQLGRD